MNTEKLSEILTDFLNSEEIDVEADYGLDFCYDYTESKVYYSFLIPDRSGEWLMEFAKEHGLKYDCGSFFLSFFHEVGHHLTIDLLDEDEEEYSSDMKKSLSSTREDNFIYFNLPDEKIATEWAINYINNNKEKLSELSLKIQPLIKSIYSSLSA